MTEIPKLGHYLKNLIFSPFLSKSYPPGVQEKTWGRICPLGLKGPNYAGFYRVNECSDRDSIKNKDKHEGKDNLRFGHHSKFNPKDLQMEHPLDSATQILLCDKTLWTFHSPLGLHQRVATNVPEVTKGTLLSNICTPVFLL